MMFASDESDWFADPAPTILIQSTKFRPKTQVTTFLLTTFLLTHLQKRSYMAEPEKPHSLLQKPLFIFSLPSELLDTLTLKGDSQATPTEDIPQKTVESQEPVGSRGAGCVTCNIASFPSVSEQRDHVRSDLHKFNLKRKVAGQVPVDAEEFDKMLDGTNFSINKLMNRSK